MTESALPPGKHIVIGLGSGRSGTASLTSLLDRQHGGLCFHEMNPAGSVFSGNPQPARNAVREFVQLLRGGERNALAIDYSRPASVATYQRLQALGELNLLGDIAFYYLHYVDDLLAVEPGCRFVCIKRDREQTVASWLKKTAINRWPSLWLGDKLRALVTRTPFHTAYNYWQVHDGSQWQPDPVWDSCFPNIEAGSRVEAIGRYWDMYYEEAEVLAQRHPGAFRIFDVEALNDRQGQREILAFIGLPEDRWVLGDDVHLHKSS
jgi:hypothetical protein